MKNVAENSDIVNWFFKKKFQLLVEHVFPILKITDYIARSEFQGRGSIHIHAILAADGNVTPTDLEHVIKSAQPPNEPCEIQIHEEAKQRVCDFAMNHIGLTTLHPNPDPMQWPERMPHTIDNQCLRLNIKDISDPKELSKIYESRVNLVQRHACNHNYCLSYAKRDKKNNEPKMSV